METYFRKAQSILSEAFDSFYLDDKDGQASAFSAETG
jgi:hypothetical protein